MKPLRTCFVFLLLLLFVMSVKAQYLSTRLARLGEVLGLTESLTNRSDDVLSKRTWRGKSVNIRKDEWGMVEHIGYRFFDSFMREQYPQSVCDFLERYLLELDLLKSDNERAECVFRDGVVFDGNPMNMVTDTTATRSFSIDYLSPHRYKVDWQRGKHNLRVGFNANVTLLRGMSVSELETVLSARLQKLASDSTRVRDITLVINRSNYQRDTLSIGRQTLIEMMERECPEIVLQPKTDKEETLFAINRECGFIHLVCFSDSTARLYAYTPAYNLPDDFLEKIFGKEK